MKRIVAFLLLLGIVLSLCACGEKEQSAAAEEPVAVEETTPAEAAPAEDVPSKEDATEESEPATDGEISGAEPQMAEEPMEEELPEEESKPTMEEFLATAEELDGYTFYEECEENIVKARSDYEGTVRLVYGIVEEIGNDYIVVTDSNLKVHLCTPSEEIMELKVDQYIEIVGIVESIELEQDMSFYSVVWVSVEFKTGYISNTIFSRIGEYHHSCTEDGMPQTTNIQCKKNGGGKSYIELVLDEEQKNSLTDGEEITVEGKLYKKEKENPNAASTKMVVTSIVK